MKNRRNYIPFLAGMVTMVLMGSLLSLSLAKEDGVPASGQLTDRVAYGQAGIALFGVQQKAPGEMLTTAKGTRIPAVLTYTDEKGEAHYYVEADAAARLLDVEMGAHYREELDCVDFGSDCPRDDQGNPLPQEVYVDPAKSDEKVKKVVWRTSQPRHDFDIVWYGDGDGDGNLAVTAGTPINIGGGVVMTGGASNADMPEGIQKVMAEKWLDRIKKTPLKPEYGTKLGMFTEVDPAEMDLGTFSGASMKRETLEGEEEVEHTFAFTPHLGKYAAITIENPGKVDLQIMISRIYTVGDGDEGYFPGIRVPAGQKITRAFRIDENLPLENQLRLRASAMAVNEPTQVILTAEQYRLGVQK